MFLLDWFFFVLAHSIRLLADSVTILLSPFILLYYNKLQNGLFSKKQFKTILITGGSSGIGRALALEFTSRNTNIIILGTDKNRLQTVQNEIKNKGCKNVIAKNIDVRNAEEMKKFIIEMDQSKDLDPIDLVIANAGQSHIGLSDTHYNVASKHLVDVNIVGVLNTILPSIQCFQNRKKGHIAVVGSLLSYLSMPNSGSYGATKAYLKWLCDDLRPQLKLWNIDTTLIAPGYVNSGMSPKETHSKNFGFIMEDVAARTIREGLESNKHTIDFPKLVFTFAWFIGTLHPILQRIVYDKQCDLNQAVLQVGRRTEIDPNDEFGGEC